MRHERLRVQDHLLVGMDAPSAGRLVGAVFLLPFLWFLWRGEIDRPLRARLWAIFALGGALGAVGWWMVSSGLSERVSVSQYRLAFHLTLACTIFAMVLWTALRLIPRQSYRLSKASGSAPMHWSVSRSRRSISVRSSPAFEPDCSTTRGR